MLIRRLDDSHKQFIAGEIARHVVVAGDEKHAMRRVSRFLIDSLLWCWSADGLDENGDAKRDLLKYSFDMQLHTRSAVERWESSGRKVTGLRHEHVVPRKALIALLLHLRPTESEVFELLTRMCFAVIVTKEEDGVLSKNFRDRMPTQLTRETSGEALFDRYAQTKLRHLVQQPRQAGELGVVADTAIR